ncbi:MAG: hypothetical protein ACRD1H_06865 [Vicinamibacterales bacterium]
MSSSLDNAVIAWLRAHPSIDGCELHEIAAHFDIVPDRLRDRLRRLVDRGILRQSEPVAGVADRNPSYRLASDADGHSLQ